MGGTSVQSSQPQPNIPPELQPLINNSVGGTIDVTRMLPISSFTTPNPMQVPNLTPEQVSLMNTTTALPFDLSQTAPTAAAATGISNIFGPLQGTTGYAALQNQFKDLIAPLVESAGAVNGVPINSGAMQQNLAQAAEQAVLPLAQQQQQLQAGLVSPLLSAGQSELQGAATAAQQPWEIASQQAQANYQDFLRLFGLSQQATLGPTQTILPNLTQPGTKGQYYSPLGISK